MPKLDGGSSASGAPPKRPAAVAEPSKQSGVASPSQAATSRQAALAKPKATATAATEAKQGEALNSDNKRQLVNQMGIVFFMLTVVAGLAWYVAMPYYGLGGSNILVQARNHSPNATVYRPVFDASAVGVVPDSLSVGTGVAGLTVLKGSVRNGGKETVRNIKITLEIVSGTEPLEVTHTVNQEVKSSATFEFSTLPPFDVPKNAQIKVKKIEIH
jgi:hypothetical protein